MSSANVDLVRSIYVTWERGDWSSVDWVHPEIEVVIADGPEPGASTGVAGALERASTILDAWEDRDPRWRSTARWTTSVSSCSPDVARAARRAARRYGRKEPTSFT
jgi:hypothetical protein